MNHTSDTSFVVPVLPAVGCLKPTALTPEPVPGHAPGMLSFRIRSRGEEGLFTADVMHNAIQIVRPDWNDRYCLYRGQLWTRGIVPVAGLELIRFSEADYNLLDDSQR